MQVDVVVDVEVARIKIVAREATCSRKRHGVKDVVALGRKQGCDRGSR